MKLLKNVVVGLLILIIGFGAFMIFHKHKNNDSDIKLTMQVLAELPDKYQVFYAKDEQDWKEENSVTASYNNVGEWEQLIFQLPREIEKVRIDLGTKPQIVNIKELSITGNVKVGIPLDKIQSTYNQLKIPTLEVNSFNFHLTGEDSYFSFKISPYILESYGRVSIINLIKDIILSLLVCATLLFSLRYSREIVRLTKTLFSSRRLILNLAKNDFKTKYASSYLGVTWGFIQPILTVVTYWFVFQIGMRSGNVSEVPFILWFIAGIVPWFFFSDAFTGATNALSEYGYLVKKVVFQVELLPVVKIVSALFVHLFFLGFILCVYSFYGYYPSLYNFQVLYYLFCMLILIISLSYLTSAVVLFLKDLNQIIVIVLQIGFWFTPIGWPLSILTEKWRIVFQLNPMYYIVQGYRDSFIDRILFIHRPIETLYFWLVCTTIITVSVMLFKKLRPHFADVL